MVGPLILAFLTSLTPLPSSINAARRPLLLLLFKVNRGFSPPFFLACPSDTTHTNGECPREQKEADSSQPFFFFPLLLRHWFSAASWLGRGEPRGRNNHFPGRRCMCVHGRVFVQSRQLNVPVSRHREEIETNMFFTALETGVTFNRSCPAVSPNTRHFGAVIVFLFFYSFIVFARHKQACI